MIVKTQPAIDAHASATAAVAAFTSHPHACSLILSRKGPQVLHLVNGQQKQNSTCTSAFVFAQQFLVTFVYLVYLVKGCRDVCCFLFCCCTLIVLSLGPWRSSTAGACWMTGRCGDGCCPYHTCFGFYRY